MRIDIYESLVIQLALVDDYIAFITNWVTHLCLASLQFPSPFFLSNLPLEFTFPKTTSMYILEDFLFTLWLAWSVLLGVIIIACASGVISMDIGRYSWPRIQDYGSLGISERSKSRYE